MALKGALNQHLNDEEGEEPDWDEIVPSPPECDCEIDYIGWEVTGIIKCPLCKAAPKLYAALVLAEQTILGQAKDYSPHDWRMRVLDDRLPTIRAALDMVKP